MFDLATILVLISIVGFYQNDSVTYFCFDVEDADVQLFEIAINQTENLNETIR